MEVVSAKPAETFAQCLSALALGAGGRAVSRRLRVAVAGSP